MKFYKQWDIHLAEVAFESDESKHEICPVLILSDNLYAVLSTKVTHHEPRKISSEDYAIIDWKGAGLHQPSTLRIHRTISLKKNKIFKKIGTLQQIDRDYVWDMIKNKKA